MAQDNDSNPRRKFLGQAVCAAAGTLLALPALPASAEAETAAATELTLPLSKHTALDKVGGFEIMDAAEERVIVARTGEKTFAACSAKCPHRGVELEYDGDNKQFVCPAHGSKFSNAGKRIGGPARTDIKSYPAEPAAVVSIKPAPAKV